MNHKHFPKKNKPSFVVVMITNGPGELSTWVRPLAEKLHRSIAMNPRSNTSNIALRLVLVPCPNATGQERKVADAWNYFDKITPPSKFWKILLLPQKFGFWPKKGLVIFLGGDQFWSVLLAKRLNYINITYAEWVARWPFFNDQILAMSQKVKQKLPKNSQKKCVVVGDLMADLKQSVQRRSPLPPGKWVAILPGSKKAKLCVGIPFFLEFADQLSQLLPDLNFLIPVASTTSIEEFKLFSSTKNRISLNYKSGIKEIINSDNKIISKKYLITNENTKVYLIEEQPAYEILSQCDLALTTVGANTAELGALNVPMIVILPTQHLEVMEAWDGLLGIIARLPIFKWFFKKLLTLWRLRKKEYMAWPNIIAKRMIVPERFGEITPKSIANEAAELLKSPERLKGQKEDLISLRGNKGAIQNIINEIKKYL